MESRERVLMILSAADIKNRLVDTAGEGEGGAT